MYYIKGDKERGTEVIAALEAKGGKNTYGYDGSADNLFYYITKNNAIKTVAAIQAFAIVFDDIMTELTLPEPEWKPTRGETVLVRHSDEDSWKEAIFSYYDDESVYSYNVVGGNMYRFCIPFDISKLGKTE